MTREQLEASIAVAWARIADALGAERAEFEIELTALLRELEHAPDQPATIAAVFALFDRHPLARAILQQSLSEMAVTKSGANRIAAEPAVRYTVVPVLFGTCRAVTGQSDPAHRFAGDRGANSFGVVDVSIPDDHRMGRLEKPMVQAAIHARP